MKSNIVFSVAEENKMVPGCTLSKKFYDENGYVFMHFSLAPKTSISAETYSTYKLIIMVSGSMDVFTKADEKHLADGELIVLPRHIPVGMKTSEGAIYTELILRDDSKLTLKEMTVYGLHDFTDDQMLLDDELFSLQMLSVKDGRRVVKTSLLYVFEGSGSVDGKAIHAGQNYLGEDYVLKSDPHLKGLLLVKEK